MHLALPVGQFGEHHLAAEHTLVEYVRRARVEVRRDFTLELIGDQAAVGAHRVHEQLRVALLHDGGHAKVQKRRERCVDHEHDAEQAAAQSVDQSLHSTLMTRTFGSWATSRNHMKVTAFGSA